MLIYTLGPAVYVLNKGSTYLKLIMKRGTINKRVIDLFDGGYRYLSEKVFKIFYKAQYVNTS